MELDEYRKKRDFRATPEPEGGRSAGHARPIFVVQEHHATRLHYDFRLEADGVLKSWAVPKQPSTDPADKRLAVHVEDHPLDYAKFAGRIPEGHYGAGVVKIWDHGTYDNILADKPKPATVPEAIDAGHVEVFLHGRKLKGRYALIRMRGRKSGSKENWLLLKMKDEYARPVAEHAQNMARRRKARRAKRQVRKTGAAGELVFSNTEKVLFPDAGIRKADVLDYYRRIAPRLLPFLRDRPATLERLPEGLAPNGPRFWQKNVPAHYPSWIPRVHIPTETGKSVHYAVVNELDTLLYLVNQGTLTFHTWLSRVQSLDTPDFVLFDLDPGEAGFDVVIAIARDIHKRMRVQKRSAVVKTSGKTGLHVMVPWQGGGYDEARAWAQEIAHDVANGMPDAATTEIRKAKRGKRVYIDTLQNARGHHAVAPYVIRATPTATVSTPLRWTELTAELNPKAFDLHTIFRRLAHQSRDPLAGLLG